MRYALVLTAAALFAPSDVRAADPPITFQTQPLDRLLGDLRIAADLVGGEKVVKAFNDGIKAQLGEKGFEGLDLNKPIVGYVILGPSPKTSWGSSRFRSRVRRNSSHSANGGTSSSRKTSARECTKCRRSRPI